MANGRNISKVVEIRAGTDPNTRTIKSGQYAGCLRCFKARKANVDSDEARNAPPQKQMCDEAGLILQVGKNVFTNLKPTECKMNNSFDVETMESLEGDTLADLAQAFDNYNLKQAGYGVLLGVGAGLVVPKALQMWKTKPKADGGISLAEGAKIAAPALLLGTGSYFLSRRSPEQAVALAAIGGLMSAGIAMSRLDKKTKSFTISFDSLPAGAEATAAELVAAAPAADAAVAATELKGLGILPPPKDFVDLGALVPTQMLEGNVLVDQDQLQGDYVDLGDDWDQGYIDLGDEDNNVGSFLM